MGTGSVPGYLEDQRPRVQQLALGSYPCGHERGVHRGVRGS